MISETREVIYILGNIVHTPGLGTGKIRLAGSTVRLNIYPTFSKGFKAKNVSHVFRMFFFFF
jgi:hypothetical protein